jgi:hypothetical protein
MVIDGSTKYRLQPYFCGIVYVIFTYYLEAANVFNFITVVVDLNRIESFVEK